MEQGLQSKSAKLVIASTLKENRHRISDDCDNQCEINKIKVNKNKC